MLSYTKSCKSKYKISDPFGNIVLKKFHILISTHAIRVKLNIGLNSINNKIMLSQWIKKTCTDESIILLYSDGAKQGDVITLPREVYMQKKKIIIITKEKKYCIVT